LKVTVLMFGALGEAAKREDTFEIPGEAEGDATVAVVVDAVRDRYPDASPILDRCCVAVNQDVCDITHAIGEGDEVAILPPMSGGSIWVRLSGAPSTADALEALSSTTAGGTVTFTGTVRDSCELGVVEALEYSAYEPMADKVMHEIAEQAIEKWSLEGVAIDHAVGARNPGEITFVVVCAAARRDEAFEACRFVVDEVKRRAPIWKKESGPWGARWVGL
jgi:molybdopterin synthase catalytic subunit